VAAGIAAFGVVVTLFAMRREEVTMEPATEDAA
jgi:hypothetical protein